MKAPFDRSIVVSPIAYESGLGLMIRTAYRLGSGSAYAFMKSVCPELKGGGNPSTRASQLSSLLAYVGPESRNDIETVLSRYSNLSAVRFFTKYRMGAVPFRVKAVTKAGSWDELSMNDWWQPWGVKPTRRYCHICAEEQYQKYGFTTWLLPHQIGETKVCFEHCKWLSEYRGTAKIDLAQPPRLPGGRLGSEKEVPAEAIAEAQLAKMLIDFNLPWFSHQARAMLFRTRLAQLEKKRDPKLAKIYPMLPTLAIRLILCPGDDSALCLLESSMKLILAMYDTPQEFFDDVGRLSRRCGKQINALNDGVSPRARPQIFTGGVLSFRPLSQSEVL